MDEHEERAEDQPLDNSNKAGELPPVDGEDTGEGWASANGDDYGSEESWDEVAEGYLSEVHNFGSQGWPENDEYREVARDFADAEEAVDASKALEFDAERGESENLLLQAGLPIPKQPAPKSYTPERNAVSQARKSKRKENRVYDTRTDKKNKRLNTKYQQYFLDHKNYLEKIVNPTSDFRGQNKPYFRKGSWVRKGIWGSKLTSKLTKLRVSWGANLVLLLIIEAIKTYAVYMASKRESQLLNRDRDSVRNQFSNAESKLMAKYEELLKNNPGGDPSKFLPPQTIMDDVENAAAPFIGYTGVKNGVMEYSLNGIGGLSDEEKGILFFKLQHYVVAMMYDYKKAGFNLKKYILNRKRQKDRAYMKYVKDQEKLKSEDPIKYYNQFNSLDWLKSKVPKNE